MGSKEPMQGRCGARKKLKEGQTEADREYCTMRPLEGRTRCKFHGGTSGIGVHASQFKTGSRSKYLPERLKERFLEAQENEELLSLRDHIALFDVRLSELLMQLDQAAPVETWRALKDAVTTLKSVLYSPPSPNKVDLLQKCLKDLEKVVAKGNEQSGVWEEIQQVSAHQEKLVSAERKALVEAQQILTVEQAMVFQATVLEAVLRVVSDPTQRQQIAREFERLTVRRLPQRTGPEGATGGGQALVGTVI